MERPRVKLIKRLRDDALPPVVSDYFFNQDEKVDFLSENPIGKFWEWQGDNNCSYEEY